MAKKKYDVVIGNPPYSRNMHLDFLADGISSLKPNGEGIFIHPATWAISAVPGRSVKNRRDRLNGHIKELNFVRGIFKTVDMGMDLSITKITSKKNVEIKVNDTLNHNGVYSAPNINTVNKWGGSTELRNIIKTFDFHIKKNGSLQQFCLTNISTLGKTTRAVYALPRVCGHFDKNGPKNDFYIFWQKTGKTNKSLKKSELTDAYERFFGFSDLDQANNFQGYLKTYIARFALSIAKFDRSINPITLSTTPWMDFTQSWDDKKLADHFGLTKKELQFIADRIPAYYDDVEPLV